MSGHTGGEHLWSLGERGAGPPAPTCPVPCLEQSRLVESSTLGQAWLTHTAHTGSSAQRSQCASHLRYTITCHPLYSVIETVSSWHPASVNTQWRQHQWVEDKDSILARYRDHSVSPTCKYFPHTLQLSQGFMPVNIFFENSKENANEYLLKNSGKLKWVTKSWKFFWKKDKSEVSACDERWCQPEFVCFHCCLRPVGCTHYLGWCVQMSALLSPMQESYCH